MWLIRQLQKVNYSVSKKQFQFILYLYNINTLTKLFLRMDGLLKTEAIEWKNRPLWFDVMKRFPPAMEPTMERPTPNIEVKKILYPEDFVRA